jgi:hypothetical protein
MNDKKILSLSLCLRNIRVHIDSVCRLARRSKIDVSVSVCRLSQQNGHLGFGA